MSEADKPFVETVRIQNFGCARDVTLELTRLHALIGPNDSGKSTALAAIRTACELIRVGQRGVALDNFLDARGVAGTMVTLRWSRKEVVCSGDGLLWKARVRDENAENYEESLSDGFSNDIVDPVRGATLVRWDPDAIRRPCELIAEGGTLSLGERGERVPAIYEAVLSRDRAAFDDIEAGVRRHFPSVKSIWLPTLDRSMKGLGAILNDGTRVRAHEMSEGLLYWLAFAVLSHVDSTAFLLVEEPENGLHPSRISEVVKVLRNVSHRMQVIIATHSPLVINELQPNEVTILTRDEKAGTRATRMDRTKHFQQRQQVYALGELWLSFADGVDEAALVKDDDAKHPAG